MLSVRLVLSRYHRYTASYSLILPRTAVGHRNVLVYRFLGGENTVNSIVSYIASFDILPL